MSVNLRQQKLVTASITIPDASSVETVLPRPQTLPDGPPHANTIDWVSGHPLTRAEFEAGRAVIDLGALFIAANVFLTRLVKRQRPFTPDKTPLFPNGAAQQPEEVVIFDDATGLPTNKTSIGTLLSRLSIRDHEEFAITLRNASGGPLVDIIEVTYELGNSAADVQLGG